MMTDLTYRKLATEEIGRALETLPGWSANEVLEKTFAFSTYKDGLVFASAVGYLADKMDHHPDLQISYAKVTISLSTHDVGGISPYDFELARRIEAIEN